MISGSLREVYKEHYLASFKNCKAKATHSEHNAAITQIACQVGSCQNICDMGTLLVAISFDEAKCGFGGYRGL